MKGETTVCANAGRMLWISLGAILGANARYFLGEWITRKAGAGFPWGTLVINVTGSLVLGLLYGMLTNRWSGPYAPTLRLFIGVGFLGAYTTFSTFAYEAVNLPAGRALAYVLGSVLAGILAAFLGMRMGRVI